MKILYLAPDVGLQLNSSSGAGTHMRGAIKGFRAHGHEVFTIIGGDLTSDHTSEKYQSNLKKYVKKVIPHRFRLLIRDIRYYYHALEIVKKALPRILDFMPDVIYERSGYMNTAGLKLAQRLNIPLFEESDGHIVETYSSLYGVFSKEIANSIERCKLNYAYKIVVMFHAAIKYVALKHYQSIDKFVVKSLGVDPDSFIPVYELTRNLHDKLELNERFVVGFIAGQLQKYHGLDLMLDSAKRLKSLRPEITFIIIAGGQLVDKYRRNAQEENLTNVVFIDLVSKDEIASYMSLFNIGIVPDCVPHMFPIKLLEYGILGLCPLTPNYPLFEDILQYENKEACLFRAQCSESLMHSICSLADNPEQTKLLGEKWKTQVLEQFVWEKTVIPVLKSMEQAIDVQ